MSAAEAPSPELEVRANRRVWWGLVGVLALMLGLVAWFYLFYDIPPPDPATYHYDFKPVPPGENVLEVFERETENLRKAMNDDWSKRIQEDERLLKFEPGCEASLRAHVEAHRELLEKFQEFVREAPRSLTFPDVDSNSNTLTSFPSLNVVVDASYTMRRALMSEALSGDPAKACHGALELASFGKEISGLDQFVIHWLVTMNINSTGLVILQKALPRADLEPATIRELAQRLSACELNSLDLARSLRMELLGVANTWKSWHELKSSSSMTAILGDSTWYEQMTLKPHMTLLESIEVFQPVANSMAASWKDGLQHTKTVMMSRQKLDDFSISNWRAMAHPNRSGRAMVTLSLGAYETIFQKTIQCVTLSRCLQSALALRAFELEKGRLPERLEELVSAYLPAVPEDPVTGGPLRWNPHTACLYSVGEDGRDDGGDFDPEKFRIGDKDWGIVYPWRMAEGGEKSPP